VERAVYRDVIFRRLRALDFRWFAGKGFTFVWLKLERYLKTGWAPAPLTCGVVVTENCNLRCPMCVLPVRYEKNPRMKDTSTMRKVLDNLHDLRIGGIALSGGEPTLRSDIFELLRHAGRNGTTVTLNSNMVSLTPEKIAAIATSGLDNVNVSIDSGDPAVNDQLRGGKKVLSRVLASIKALAEERARLGTTFSITVVSTLSGLNLDEESLDALFRAVASCGADRLCFIPLHDIKDGVTFIPVQEKATPDLFERLQALARKHGVGLENSSRYLRAFYDVMSGGVMKELCNNGYTQLIIGDDLKIYRCIPFMNAGRPLFQWDPERQSLKELWNSREWRKDRKEALTCKQCFWDCHAELNFLVRM